MKTTLFAIVSVLVVAIVYNLGLAKAVHDLACLGHPKLPLSDLASR